MANLSTITVWILDKGQPPMNSITFLFAFFVIIGGAAYAAWDLLRQDDDE
jgi:hypothetical protein